jgi:tRNA A37 methylthiotransferase MiaB
VSTRTYEVRTYGCQMNVHDSERIAGLLDEAGYAPAVGDATPDLVVFNTCAVRENADNKLYGNLGHLAPAKAANPAMQIAVGGCLAQKDQATIVAKAPWVDVVFGTHNIGSLPTLLGQNVNSYGVEFGDRFAFGKLLRAVGAVDGLERVRFTSPHPKDFTDDVIAAMAETPTVMHQLHMPLQSGSDDVLRRMRRSYRQDRYLGIIERVRAAMPDAAITTDIIVGFPGETEADFEQTLDVARQARFASAFTFQYSVRPGTPAATMPDQVPKAVVQERYMRLMALVDEISWDASRALVGQTLEVLTSVGEGRKDEATHRLSGRAPDNRLVHFVAPEGVHPRPGDMVTAQITYAAPHHLVADIVHGVRRTRAGDAWESRAGSPGGRGPSTPGVSLGMPAMGVPVAVATRPDECGSGYLVDSAGLSVPRDVTSP